MLGTNADVVAAVFKSARAARWGEERNNLGQKGDEEEEQRGDRTLLVVPPVLREVRQDKTSADACAAALAGCMLPPRIPVGFSVNERCFIHSVSIEEVALLFALYSGKVVPRTSSR